MTSAPSPWLRSAAAILIAATVLVLTGCSGTGVNAQTNQQYQAGAGANLRTGDVQLYNTLAVDNGDGTATLSTVVVNTTRQTQKLDSVTATTTSGGDPIELNTAPAIIGPRDSFNTGPAGTVVFTGDTVKPGDYLTLTMSFDRAGDVTIEAPVVTRTSMYDDVARNSGGN